VTWTRRRELSPSPNVCTVWRRISCSDLRLVVGCGLSAAGKEIAMTRSWFLSTGIALCLLTSPLGLPPEASAQSSVSIDIRIGTNLNRGRGITCSEGERLLRSRGFRDVRRVDCRGRFFVYRAWRGNTRFEIAVRQWDGRVVDVRRIGRR
jgi:hypothetical protein